MHDVLSPPRVNGRPPAEATSGGDARPLAAGGRTPFLAAGNPRPVVEAAITVAAVPRAVLALVLETTGSTYALAGTMALFAPDAQAGWLSGGCLEPELARRAARAAEDGRLDWVEIDTRDDADLLSGSALGCRGRLRIALLPLAALPGVERVLSRWWQGGVVLHRQLGREGEVRLQAGDAVVETAAATAPLPWNDGAGQWSLPLPRPPELQLLGAGPETPMMIGLLRGLGWRIAIAERRPRWLDAGEGADARFASAQAACAEAAHLDAALVMHHNFELDREALEVLAATEVPFVGLLGPPRRRDDLLKLLAPAQREALRPRLRAPVGLDLGGRGPEAIALSIAAQLQDWRGRAGAAQAAAA